MGWASGRDVAEGFVLRLKKLPGLTLEQRTQIYDCLIRALEDNDWDTQNEMRGMDPAFDAALGPEDDDE